MSKHRYIDPDHEDLSEESTILTACALRFDGAKYVDARKFNYAAALRTIEQTGDLAPFEKLQHLALFYMLQRFLHKWGGETLSGRSPQWNIYRQLFFLCCRSKIPQAYQLEPYYSEWMQDYAPRIDVLTVLVKHNHEHIDYLTEQSIHPSYIRDATIERQHQQRRQLGLSDESMRRFEQEALELLEFFPDATISRTRDAIQIDIRGESGIVLILTPEACELRLPTVSWVHPHVPIRLSKLGQRILWGKMSRDKTLKDLCNEMLRVREDEYKLCRFCGREFPPEHRHSDDVCHGCAERHLGVVH